MDPLLGGAKAPLKIAASSSGGGVFEPVLVEADFSKSENDHFFDFRPIFHI
jgi:hypothetical protein